MRKFLVVLDDSKECLNAIRFAALRAARTGYGVQILSVIPPEEFQHFMGVADLMRAEARERIEAHFEVYAKWMRDRQGVTPELVIREGDPVEQLMAQITEDPQVGILVLGAGTDNRGPGPLVTHLARNSGALPVPVLIVPGDLPRDKLEEIAKG
ncbi:universal stress protein [Rhodobacteraceae bacterium 2376]|uniref:Universal stress protein n=1 Tax=Rhabdonatronobacter sediminivivens TaxID=2743469 RepID=A0A7Z0HX69_9RHOB|nr:universal stress protein [Rhabdonatronobacter sediminivivens]NYS23815.1 universal stress protein [Rhabdonatronobacter sediminivivens]